MPRPKGSKNIKTFQCEEIAQRFALEPIEVLLMAINGDWKGLGYDGPVRTEWTSSGIEYEVPTIKLEHRIDAAKQACRYLYTQKASVTVQGGTEPIRIIVEDYTSKK